MRGKAAIAQAKIAYAMFVKSFGSSQWQALAQSGAQVQRPLWASTSTKNPDYPDTMYVDHLIGPHSVNTLPDTTMEAFRDHGSIAETITHDVDEAHRTLSALASLGINMSEVADKLEREGVASFAQSFNDVLQVLEDKRSR